jgi:hypothetical protein
MHATTTFRRRTKFSRAAAAGFQTPGSSMISAALPRFGLESFDDDDQQQHHDNEEINSSITIMKKSLYLGVFDPARIGTLVSAGEEAKDGPARG